MIQGQISNNLLVFRQVLYFFGIYMNWRHTRVVTCSLRYESDEHKQMKHRGRKVKY